MNRSRVAYTSVGIVLVGVAGASVVWASSTAPATQAAAPAPDATATKAAPVTPARMPADSVITGITAAVAKAQRIATETDAPSQAIHICDSTVTGWLRSDSQRLTTKEAGVTIFVGAWRAGAAATAFGDLKQAAQRCHIVDQQYGRDQLMATSSTADGQRAVAAVRNGDVLTVVLASSVRSDPAAVAGRISGAASTIVRSRLRGICADPSNRIDSQATTRDPYTPNYAGLRVTTVTGVPDNPILNQRFVTSLTTTSNPYATWTAPTREPVPTLAPVLPPTIGGGIERGPAPKLVDPATILPPTDPQPTTFTDAVPPTPKTGPGKSRALTPTVDRIGPGCGWSFTSTTAPNTTPRALTTGSQAAVVQALLDTTAEQGKAMTASLTWPERYITWSTARRQQANWDAYRLAVEQAKTELADARATYRRSVARWKRGPSAPIVPTPTPTPVPSTSPSTAVAP